MRFAILSDLHSNLQAWRAVSADLKNAGVDQVVCLGDIVGYGPNPAEVLEEVASLADHVVLGNHDAVIGGRFDSSCFSDHARIAIEWTQKQLSDSAGEFFKEMPAVLRGPAFAVSHAEYEIPERFDYIFEPSEALPSFRATQDPVMFFGHTHVPGVFRFDRETAEIDLLKPGLTHFNPAYRYLINAGSVGDPRDGDVRASYVIFDAERQCVDFRKVAFDIPAYQSALRRSRLPTRPLFFQFLEPSAQPAAEGLRTRVFQAGAEQVRQATRSSGQRTLVIDPANRPSRIRAAGSGSFANRGMTAQRKRQVGVIGGVAALVFLSVAGLVVRHVVTQSPAAGNSAAAGPLSAPDAGGGLGEGLAAWFLAEEDPLGTRLASAGTLSPTASLTPDARPGPGILGKGVLLGTPASTVTVAEPPSAAAGAALSWWMLPGQAEQTLLAWGTSLTLLRKDGDLHLVTPSGTSVWGPLPSSAPIPYTWGPLALAGGSFTWSAWLRLDRPGVLYSEPGPESGRLRLSRTADALVLALGSRTWSAPVPAPGSGDWQHVAFLYDHPTGRLAFQVDGKTLSEVTADLTPASSSEATAAASPAGPRELVRLKDSSWKYRKGLSAPPAGWNRPDFTEDASWLTGQAGFGYGDGDDVTVLEDMKGPPGYTSLFLRRTFSLAAPGGISRLGLRVNVDDGCVVYLNGGEVLRHNVPGSAGQMPAFDGLAAANRGESVWLAPMLENAPSLLRDGPNVLAVYACNATAKSSDFSIDVELIANPDAAPGLAETAPAAPVLGGDAAGPGSSVGFQGDLDGLRVFRRALAAGERAGLMAAAGAADAPDLLVRQDFESAAGAVLPNPAGLGFELKAPATYLVPGREGKALRLTPGAPVAFEPGFLPPPEGGDAPSGLPRAPDWHHVVLSLLPEGGTVLPSLWWDGVLLGLRSGERALPAAPSGPAAWTGPASVDEIALYARPLRAGDARELTGRLYVSRAAHPLGRLVLPGWLKREENLLVSFSMQAAAQPAALAAALGDLRELALRTRGTALAPRVREKLREAEVSAGQARARILEQLLANARDLAAKGRGEDAAGFLESYSGSFAVELAPERRARAAEFRRQAVDAASALSKEADGFYQSVWTEASRALLDADWPGLARLVERGAALAAKPGADRAHDADLAVLRNLATIPLRAGDAFARVEAQNVILDLAGQREATYHVLGVVSNHVQLAPQDGANRRRLAVPLDKLSLRSLSARLEGEPALENAALRACALARLGRLDKALEQLQGREHPLAAALRQAIVDQPARGGGAP